MPPTDIVVDILFDAEITCPLSRQEIQESVTMAALHRGFSKGQIGVRVTDDAKIHAINRDHLNHDYPTDVISFDYGSFAPNIEGELVVSVDTAREKAEEYAWDEKYELLLYIVHGTLHIAGMDDQNSNARNQMRQAEVRVLGELGISLPERCSPDGGIR